MTKGTRVVVGLLLALAVGASGCDQGKHSGSSTGRSSPSDGAASAGPRSELFPGMPGHVSESNVYAAAGPGMLSEQVRADRPRIYVPHTKGDDIWVIDPATYRVIDKFPVRPEPQHVVPSYDMRTLYVAASRVPSGGLVPIDARTGRPGKAIDVEDVYNLYFTPDGRQAIVVAEYYKRLDFYDPRTWQRVRSVSFPKCAGINHMDYSADGRIMLFSCEFANRVLALDTATLRELRHFDLDQVDDGMPQDTRLTPDGRHFLVADMHANGVYVFDGAATRQVRFIPTGRGAHGIYFSRDARVGYVTNRDEGSVTLLDLATLRPTGKWRIPGGGSPDMGGLSADGTVLWLSGRYHNEVYALRTSDGKLLARIPVGKGPHGLTVWPQPGRYSLGHTANIR